MPPGDLVPGQRLPTRPIGELVSFDEEGLRIAPDAAFPQAEPSPWADIPSEPITLDELTAKY